MALGAAATFVGTVWTVSAKLVRHDMAQTARDSAQDAKIGAHELAEAENFKQVKAQIVQATIDIQAQIARSENDILRLKRRESEMSDQINKVDLLSTEDRKRSDEDRKVLTAQMSNMSELYHAMNATLIEVHTIVKGMHPSTTHPRRNKS